MDMESLMWDIGGAVMGILSALATLYLLKVTDNIFSRLKKQSPKKDEEKE